MTIHGNQVLQDALALPPDERAELAEHVLASLDPPNRKRIDAEWAAEAEERIDAYERGDLPTIAAEEVYRQYRERGNL